MSIAGWFCWTGGKPSPVTTDPAGRMVGRMTTHPHIQLSAAVSPIAAAEGAAPEWVMLLPPSPIKPADGRPAQSFNAEEVLEASRASGRPLVVDFDHQTDLYMNGGTRAPAAGWIEEMEIRDGAIWGRIDWTPDGRNALASKSYRFLSPTTLHHPKTGQLLSIGRAALVNNPALPEIPALAAMETSMTKEADPAPKATPDPLSRDAAIAMLSSKLQGDADGERILNALKSGSASATKPDPAAFVPRDVFDDVVKRFAALEQEIKSGSAATAVDNAIESGKLTPAMREWAEDYAATNPQGFAVYVESAPTLLGGAAAPGAQPPGSNSTAGGHAAEICKALGLDAETFAATRKAETGEAD